MHPTVVDRLTMRNRARAIGDAGLERACNADLARYGYRETATVDSGEMEAAVPDRPRRGRPPKPRCEHGQIPDRCLDCQEDA